MEMDKTARKALRTIRACVEDGRYTVLTHFLERMDQRGLVWPDVQAVLDDPEAVQDGGQDRLGRPKWMIVGTAADGLELEIVCVLDQDERGELTVFITIY